MARVFISHRGVDTDAAKRLASSLRALNHEVWLDTDEIRAGDSIVRRINDGLSSADALILIIGHGDSSDWVNVEWMSTLARQLNGEGVRVLPARLGLTPGPAILADLRYADLASDWDSAVAELQHALTLL